MPPPVLQVPTPDPLQTAGAPAWIDWVALGVVLALAAIGFRKGLAWQLVRLGIVVTAFVVALAAGPRVAPWLADVVHGTGDPALPHHVAHAGLFVATMAVLGLCAWLLHRPPADATLTRGNRGLAAAFGALSGALAMVAVLTGLQMFLGAHGLARTAVASATTRSTLHVLVTAERVLPGRLASGARAWRRVLRDPALAARPRPDGVVPLRRAPTPGQEPRDAAGAGR